ncbi:MAG: RHS repeat protein, partial [Chloroflexi bacterium]|nr:RHS repeat protein [Chloroflexota bacterium]
MDAVDAGDAASYWGKPYRIKTFVAATPTDVRQDLKYWWDAAGNLTSRKDVLASETEAFSYDSLDRLVGVNGPYSESFTYDVLGNMT